MPIVVGPDQLQRVEALRQLVEQQVLGAADPTSACPDPGLFAPGLLIPDLLAAILDHCLGGRSRASSPSGTGERYRLVGRGHRVGTSSRNSAS